MQARAKKTKPAPEERTTLIGEAAIEVLAAEGSRGLTHRAVDRYLGWPEGTTSRYYRTRDALMTAVVRHLIDIEIGHIEQWRKESEIEGQMTAAKVSRLLAKALRDWIDVGSRHIARYELSLEARRRPAVHEAIIKGRNILNGIVSRALEVAGFPDPAAQATMIVSGIDGFCHDSLLHPEIAVDPAHVEGVILRWLEAERTAPADAYAR